MKKILKMIFLCVKQDHLIWTILSWKRSFFSAMTRVYYKCELAKCELNFV